MEKEILPLEERVRKLEAEVERLRKIIESHVRDHGPFPFQPDPNKRPGPHEPRHPDFSPPREF